MKRIAGAVLTLFVVVVVQGQTGRIPAPLEQADRVAVKITAAAMEFEVAFPDGCDSETVHLPHGLTLEGDGCAVCVVEGVLDTRFCTVTLTANQELGRARLNFYDGAEAMPFGARLSELPYAPSCETEQLFDPCTIGFTTLPYKRIEGVTLSGGWFDGLAVVR